MSGYGRRIAGFFSLMMIHPMIAAEKKSIPIMPHQSIATGSLGLSGSSSGTSPQSPGSGMSAYLSSAFNEFCNVAASGLKSATETVSNKVSDESAFKKLGWPLSDPGAQSELTKSLARYKAHQELLSKSDYYRLPDYAEHKAFVDRRRGYLTRAIPAFHTLPDGIQFATHCLEHHRCIMTPFDKDEIDFFLDQKEQATQNASETRKRVS